MGVFGWLGLGPRHGGHAIYARRERNEHVVFGTTPKVSKTSRCPSAVLSIMSMYDGQASSCIDQPPLMNSSCPDATRPCTAARFAGVCSDHHRVKNACST